MQIPESRVQLWKLDPITAPLVGAKAGALEAARPVAAARARWPLGQGGASQAASANGGAAGNNPIAASRARRRHSGTSGDASKATWHADRSAPRSIRVGAWVHRVEDNGPPSRGPRGGAQRASLYASALERRARIRGRRWGRSRGGGEVSVPAQHSWSRGGALLCVDWHLGLLAAHAWPLNINAVVCQSFVHL